MFGPVLHVLRYRREGLDALIDAINAAGYGLTFGLHTRIDETIARVVERIEAGNIYVNRNIIGATVGVQPFGGSRLSGTGPKAGGPLYLARLVAEPPQGALDGAEGSPSALGALRVYIDWLARRAMPRRPSAASGYASRSPLGARVELPGPVGERNVYALGGAAGSRLWRRTEARRSIQIGAILATGNDAIVSPGEAMALKGLPPELAHRVTMALDPLAAPALAGALFEGEAEALADAMRRLATRPGPIVRLQALTPARLAAGEDFDLAALVEEERDHDQHRRGGRQREPDDDGVGLPRPHRKKSRPAGAALPSATLLVFRRQPCATCASRRFARFRIRRQPSNALEPEPVAGLEVAPRRKPGRGRDAPGAQGRLRIDRMRVAEIERRADRLDPEAEVAPVPRRVAAAAVRHPEQHARKDLRVPFHHDPVAFRAVGQPRHALVPRHQKQLLGVEGQRQTPRTIATEPSSIGTAPIPAHVRPCATRDTPASKKPG